MPSIQNVAELGRRLNDLGCLKRAEESSNKAATTLMGLSPETKALLDSGMSLAEALRATCAKIPPVAFTGSTKQATITCAFGQAAQPSNPFYVQMWTQEKSILEECIKHATDANLAVNSLSQEAQLMLKECSYSAVIHTWNEDIFMYMRSPGSSSKAIPAQERKIPGNKCTRGAPTMGEMLADLRVLQQLKAFCIKVGDYPAVFPPDAGYATLQQIASDLHSLRQEPFDEEAYTNRITPIRGCVDESIAKHLKESIPAVVAGASRALAEKLLQLSPEARRLLQEDKVPIKDVEARWDSAVQEFVGL